MEIAGISGDYHVLVFTIWYVWFGLLLWVWGSWYLEVAGITEGCHVSGMVWSYLVEISLGFLSFGMFRFGTGS